MTTFYNLAARLSGTAALVCAVLALLTSPAMSRAEPSATCEECYELFPLSTDYDGFMICSAYCQSSGGAKCIGNCDDGGCAGTYPNCSMISKGCRKSTGSDCASCRCVSNKALIPDCHCW